MGQFKSIKDFIKKEILPRVSKEDILTALKTQKKYTELKRQKAYCKVDISYLEEKRKFLKEFLEKKEVKMTVLGGATITLAPPSWGSPLTEAILEGDVITLYFDDNFNVIDMSVWGRRFYRGEVWKGTIIERGSEFYDYEGIKRKTLYQVLVEEIGDVRVEDVRVPANKDFLFKRFFQEFENPRKMKEVMYFFDFMKTRWGKTLEETELEIKQTQERLQSLQRLIEQFNFPPSYDTLFEIYEKHREDEVFWEVYRKKDPYCGYSRGACVPFSEWLTIILKELEELEREISYEDDRGLRGRSV